MEPADAYRVKREAVIRSRIPAWTPPPNIEQAKAEPTHSRFDWLFETEGYLAICIGASLTLAAVAVAGMIVASYAAGGLTR